MARTWPPITRKISRCRNCSFTRFRERRIRLHDAEAGKFYRPGAKLRFPIYLDENLQAYFSAAAERKGIPLQQLVNELLQKEIAIVEAIR
jgi:hypothetical protein